MTSSVNKVLIVGGGFTGMSAALHLAEAGISVALVEANEIGFGGSGRNAGLVNPGFWLPLPDMIKALGQDAAERMIDDLGNAPSVVYDLVAKHGIECEAVNNGNLHMAHSPGGYADLAARCEEWSKRGAPVEMFDKATAASMTGTKAYYGAMIDRRAGTIQPLAYVRGLAHAAVKNGVQVFTQSPATSIARTGDKWAVKTPGGRLSAELVRMGCFPIADFHFIKTNSIIFYFYFNLFVIFMNLKEDMFCSRMLKCIIYNLLNNSI